MWQRDHDYCPATPPLHDITGGYRTFPCNLTHSIIVQPVETISGLALPFYIPPSEFGSSQLVSLSVRNTELLKHPRRPRTAYRNHSPPKIGLTHGSWTPSPALAPAFTPATLAWVGGSLAG